MLRLYILRHGETDFNRQRIVQGSGVNAPLNETGRLQAQKFFDKYKNVPFETVYCSDLIRTYQTVRNFEILSPIQKKQELNELSWGVIEGKEFTGEVVKIYQNINDRWTKGFTDESIEGGESPQQVWERVDKVIDEILQSHKENVLICTHGRTMRILFCELLGYGMKHQLLFEHHNTSLTVLRHQGNKNFFIEKWNDLSHLKS